MQWSHTTEAQDNPQLGRIAQLGVKPLCAYSLTLTLRIQRVLKGQSLTSHHVKCHHKVIGELQQRVQEEEGQPTEQLQWIEHELQHLSLSLQPSAPAEPLDEVLKHYMETLCTAQKQNLHIHYSRISQFSMELMPLN